MTRLNKISNASIVLAADKCSSPLQFLMFSFFPLEVLSLRGIPVNEFAAIAIVIAAFHRPPRSHALSPWWIPALFTLWLWCLVSTLLAPVDIDSRRLGHLVVWSLLVIVVASGRVHLRSMAGGLIFGLVIGSLSGLLRVGGLYGYEGRLTGLFGEPNVAGLVLIVYGLIAFSLIHRRWQIVALSFSAVALVLTLSRTSLMALGLGVSWMVLARRSHWAVSLMFVASLVPLVFVLAEPFKNWGPFSEREGSDLLRERIIASEVELISQRPFLGNGAGTAEISVNGFSFFFHSSYYALQAEFGMVAVVLYVILATTIFFKMITLPREYRNFSLEAAFIGVGVCAMHLGEVLLHLPAALVLGVALRWVSAAWREQRLEQLHSTSNSGRLP